MQSAVAYTNSKLGIIIVQGFMLYLNLNFKIKHLTGLCFDYINKRIYCNNFKNLITHSFRAFFKLQCAREHSAWKWWCMRTFIILDSTWLWAISLDFVPWMSDKQLLTIFWIIPDWVKIFRRLSYLPYLIHSIVFFQGKYLFLIKRMVLPITYTTYLGVTLGFFKSKEEWASLYFYKKFHEY